MRLADDVRASDARLHEETNKLRHYSRKSKSSQQAIPLQTNRALVKKFYIILSFLFVFSSIDAASGANKPAYTYSL